MLIPLERVKIWAAVTIGWRRRGKLSEAIRAFQATEADGVWHLQRGIRRVHDARQKAIIFTHSLEEESHAEEFRSVYHQYADRPMTPAAYERSDLYASSEPEWKTFAYVHVGEKDATDRFRLLREALPEGALKESLRRIVADEEGHVDLTDRMLIKMGATSGDIRREVLKIRLLRAWEGWLRTGKRVIDSAATILLSVAYFAIGPFLFLAARRKLGIRFVEFDNNRIKRL